MGHGNATLLDTCTSPFSPTQKKQQFSKTVSLCCVLLKSCSSLGTCWCAIKVELDFFFFIQHYVTKHILIHNICEWLSSNEWTFYSTAASSHVHWDYEIKEKVKKLRVYAMHVVYIVSARSNRDFSTEFRSASEVQNPCQRIQLMAAIKLCKPHPVHQVLSCYSLSNLYAKS